MNKIKDIKIKKNVIRSNKQNLFFCFEINLKKYDDYIGKNPEWAIFWVENEDIYLVRWLDYNGWREVGNGSDNFTTFEEASDYLMKNIKMEAEGIYSRNGIVKRYSEKEKKTKKQISVSLRTQMRMKNLIGHFCEIYTYDQLIGYLIDQEIKRKN